MADSKYSEVANRFNRDNSKTVVDKFYENILNRKPSPQPSPWAGLQAPTGASQEQTPSDSSFAIQGSNAAPPVVAPVVRNVEQQRADDRKQAELDAARYAEFERQRAEAAAYNASQNK